MQIVTNKRLKIAEKFIGMRNAYNHNCKRGGDGLLIRNKKVTNRSDRDSKLRNIIIVEGDGTMKNKKMTFLTGRITVGAEQNSISALFLRIFLSSFCDFGLVIFRNIWYNVLGGLSYG